NTRKNADVYEESPELIRGIEDQLRAYGVTFLPYEQYEPLMSAEHAVRSRWPETRCRCCPGISLPRPEKPHQKVLRPEGEPPSQVPAQRQRRHLGYPATGRRCISRSIRRRRG